MKLMPMFRFPTKAGTVELCRSGDGRVHIVWNNESLGSYINAAQAADDASGGHCFSPSDGTDLERLGISADLGDWLRVQPARPR